MIRNIDELSSKIHLIPEVVVIDALKRIIDWTSSGGSYQDDYVVRQINYALSFIKEDKHEQ